MARGSGSSQNQQQGDLTFNAVLQDNVSPQVDKIVEKLQKLGASKHEIKIAVKAHDDATQRVKAVEEHLKRLPKEHKINFAIDHQRVNAEIDKVRTRAVEIAKKPVDIAVNVKSNVEQEMAKIETRMTEAANRVRQGAANIAASPIGTTAQNVAGVASNAVSSSVGIPIAGAASVAGIAAIAQQSFQLNSQREQDLQALRATLKSVSESQAEMARVTTFARTTPFNQSEVLQSNIEQLNYGINPQGPAGNRAAGDIAAGTGQPLDRVTYAITSALQRGDYRILRNIGVRLDKEDFATGGRFAGVSPQQAIQRVSQLQYGGATQNFARTFEGMLSNVQDVAQLNVMTPIGQTAFNSSKGLLQGINQKISGEGPEAERFQQQLAKIVQAVNDAVAKIITEVKQIKQTFDTYFKQPLTDILESVSRLAVVFAKTFGGITSTALKGVADVLVTILEPIASIAEKAPVIIQLFAAMKAFQMLGLTQAANPIQRVGAGVNPMSGGFGPRNVIGGAMDAMKLAPLAGAAFVGYRLTERSQSAEALRDGFDQYGQAGERAADRLISKYESLGGVLSKTTVDLKRIAAEVNNQLGPAFSMQERTRLLEDTVQQFKGLQDAGFGKDFRDLTLPGIKSMGIQATAADRQGYLNNQKSFIEDYFPGLSKGEMEKKMGQINDAYTKFADVIAIADNRPEAIAEYSTRAQKLSEQITPTDLPAKVLNDQSALGIVSTVDDAIRSVLTQQARPSAQLLEDLQKEGNLNKFLTNMGAEVAPGVAGKPSRPGGELSGYLNMSVDSFRTTPIPGQEPAQFSDKQKGGSLYDLVTMGRDQALGIRQAFDVQNQQAQEIFGMLPGGYSDYKLPTSMPAYLREFGGEAPSVDTSKLTTRKGIAEEFIRQTQLGKNLTEVLDEQQQKYAQLDLVMKRLQMTSEGLSHQQANYNFDVVVPAQRALEDYGRVILQTSRAMEDASYKSARAQFGMSRYTEGLLEGTDALNDHIHELDMYQKSLQYLQLQQRGMMADLTTTTTTRGFTSVVKPLMGFGLEKAIEQAGIRRQMAELEKDLRPLSNGQRAGDFVYEMSKAQRTGFRDMEYSAKGAIEQVEKYAGTITSQIFKQEELTKTQYSQTLQMRKLDDAAYAAQKGLRDFADAQDKLRREMFKTNRELFIQDMYINQLYDLIPTVRQQAEGLGFMLDASAGTAGKDQVTTLQKLIFGSQGMQGYGGPPKGGGKTPAEGAADSLISKIGDVLKAIVTSPVTIFDGLSRAAGIADKPAKAIERAVDPGFSAIGLNNSVNRFAVSTLGGAVGGAALGKATGLGAFRGLAYGGTAGLGLGLAGAGALTEATALGAGAAGLGYGYNIATSSLQRAALYAGTRPFRGAPIPGSGAFDDVAFRKSVAESLRISFKEMFNPRYLPRIMAGTAGGLVGSTIGGGVAGFPGMLAGSIGGFLTAERISRAIGDALIPARFRGTPPPSLLQGIRRGTSPTASSFAYGLYGETPLRVSGTPLSSSEAAANVVGRSLRDRTALLRQSERLAALRSYFTRGPGLVDPGTMALGRTASGVGRGLGAAVRGGAKVAGPLGLLAQLGFIGYDMIDKGPIKGLDKQGDDTVALLDQFLTRPLAEARGVGGASSAARVRAMNRSLSLDRTSLRRVFDRVDQPGSGQTWGYSDREGNDRFAGYERMAATIALDKAMGGRGSRSGLLNLQQDYRALGEKGLIGDSDRAIESRKELNQQIEKSKELLKDFDSAAEMRGKDVRLYRGAQRDLDNLKKARDQINKARKEQLVNEKNYREGLEMVKRGQNEKDTQLVEEGYKKIAKATGSKLKDIRKLVKESGAKTGEEYAAVLSSAFNARLPQQNTKQLNESLERLRKAFGKDNRSLASAYGGVASAVGLSVEEIQKMAGTRGNADTIVRRLSRKLQDKIATGGIDLDRARLYDQESPTDKMTGKFDKIEDKTKDHVKRMAGYFNEYEKERRENNSAFWDKLLNRQTAHYGAENRRRDSHIDYVTKKEDLGGDSVNKVVNKWLSENEKDINKFRKQYGVTVSDIKEATTGDSKGYAHGGLIKADPHKVGPGYKVRVAEEGHPEVIIPLAPHRRERAKMLVDQTKSMIGYANGGFTGPFGSGAAFTPISSFAKNRFGLTMTSGKDNHNKMSLSGNISDHWYGRAGDFSNGSSPTPQMDSFNQFWKKKLPQVIKQLIWRDKDQFTGYPIGGHMDHVHVAIKDSLAFNARRMAQLLSRASRGLSVAALLRGINVSGTEGGTAVPEHKLSLVPRKLFKKGPIGATSFMGMWLVKKALSNKFKALASEAMDTPSSGDGPSDVDRDGEKLGLGQRPRKGVTYTVGASIYGTSPGDDNGLDRLGKSLFKGAIAVAELGMQGGIGNAMGKIPYGTKARVGYRGKSVGVTFRDVGSGGGPVKGYPRVLDLHARAARPIGFKDGLDLVQIQFANGGIARARAGQGLAWAGWHAKGGDFRATKPTLFGAGEAGPERISIKPERGGELSGGENTKLLKELVSIASGFKKSFDDDRLSRIASRVRGAGRAAAGAGPKAAGLMTNAQSQRDQFKESQRAKMNQKGAQTVKKKIDAAKKKLAKAKDVIRKTPKKIKQQYNRLKKGIQRATKKATGAKSAGGKRITAGERKQINKAKKALSTAKKKSPRLKALDEAVSDVKKQTEKIKELKKYVGMSTSEIGTVAAQAAKQVKTAQQKVKSLVKKAGKKVSKKERKKINQAKSKVKQLQKRAAPVQELYDEAFGEYRAEAMEEGVGLDIINELEDESYDEVGPLTSDEDYETLAGGGDSESLVDDDFSGRPPQKADRKGKVPPGRRRPSKSKGGRSNRGRASARARQAANKGRAAAAKSSARASSPVKAASKPKQSGTKAIVKAMKSVENAVKKQQPPKVTVQTNATGAKIQTKVKQNTRRSR